MAAVKKIDATTNRELEFAVGGLERQGAARLEHVGGALSNCLGGQNGTTKKLEIWWPPIDQ